MSGSDRVWIPTGECCKALGVSQKHLWKLRDEGLLELGTHCRNIARPQAARPTYRWHLARCEAALCTKPEFRGDRPGVE
jgi:hypothetical protein